MGILEEHADCVLPSRPSNPLICASLANLSSAALALASAITFLDPYCIDDATLLGAQLYQDVPLRAFPVKDGDYFDAEIEPISHALLAVRADPSALIVHRVTAGSLSSQSRSEHLQRRLSVCV